MAKKQGAKAAQTTTAAPEQGDKPTPAQLAEAITAATAELDKANESGDQASIDAAKDKLKAAQDAFAADGEPEAPPATDDEAAAAEPAPAAAVTAAAPEPEAPAAAAPGPSEESDADAEEDAQSFIEHLQAEILKAERDGKTELHAWLVGLENRFSEIKTHFGRLHPEASADIKFLGDSIQSLFSRL